MNRLEAYYGAGLSITRTALPSERGMVRGRHRVSSIVSPVAMRRRSAGATADLGERRVSGLEVAAAPREQRRRRLDLHLDAARRLAAVDDQQVVRLAARDGEQRGLDLGGIEVDALDDQHVVARALDARDARPRCGRTGTARGRAW
jgi:hypothetical protein